MKEQLELKHLAPYLPYGLKIRNILGKGSAWTLTRFNIEQFSDDDKLILRPLSDLTKKIEHNSERFVPFHKLKSKYGDDLTIDYKYKISFEDGVEGAESYSYYVELSDCYELYQYLFSWHFDVFGLIDKGLAIDINTLK